MIVLDASAALALVLPSQRTSAAIALLTGPAAGAFVVPACFAWENRGVLLRAERAGRLTAVDVDQALAMLDSLAERRSWDDTPTALSRLIALSRAEALSLFDAAYLELAIREAADLATRDASLLLAARKRGLTAHDLR